MGGNQATLFASPLGMQQTGVRVANQRTILTLITLEPGQSAAELARKSGLAPQTISAILEDLEGLGLLQRGEVLRGRRGQPATPLFLNPEGAFAIGIELGWRHIEAALINIGGEVIANYRRDYPFPDARTIFNEIGQVIAQLSAKLSDSQRTKLVDVGVSAPNGIGRNAGLLATDPAHGRLWQEIDLLAELRKLTDLPVQLYNDGSAACWAELGAQPRPRPNNFAYLHIGTFIGAGIVAEGTLWEGPSGRSADLGSMLVTDRHGEQNFLHLLASIQALEHILVGADEHVPPTTPLFWPWEDWDDHVTGWIEDAAPALAKVILNTAAVIEFDHAVIDGEVPVAVLDRIIAAVERSMASMPTLNARPPRVSRGHLGHRAPSTGSAYLPLFRRFFSRDLAHIQG